MKIAFGQKSLFSFISSLGAMLLLLLTANMIEKKIPFQEPDLEKQTTALNFNTDFLKLLSLGQKRVISDTLWIQTLLDSDLVQYKKKDLNSWMHLRFDSISELDPLFYENYYFGGRYLAIIKDDILGANKLLEKGLKIFPSSKKIREMLAFNYAFELHDYASALPHYEELIKMKGTPTYYKSILIKLKLNEYPDMDLTISSVENLIKSIGADEKMLKKKLLKDLENLKIKRDIDCLNSGGIQEECTLTGPNGVKYIKDSSGKYAFPKSYKPFQLFHK